MENISFEKVKNLIPKRREDAHKGDFGTLLAICGSAFYRGAALLCCEAALRCGVGILRLCSTEKVIDAVASQLPEVTYLPCKEGANGEINLPLVQNLLEDNPKASAILCGCGLTNTPLTKSMVYDLIENSTIPLIIDADGLNCIGQNTSLLKKAKHTPVITPHIGEFARLCGVDIDVVKSDAERIATDFSKEHNCVLVLKSHKTIVVSPDGETSLLNAPNPGLSRGGSGDVLAGIIASFRAQGLSALDSAKLGVTIHSVAAQKTAKRLGTIGMLPHDIIFDITTILKESEI